MNTGSDCVQYYDFITNQVETVHLNNDHPTAATVYRGRLYYANQDDNAIHVANKTTGAENVILRNNTGKYDDGRFKVIWYKAKCNEITLITK